MSEKIEDVPVVMSVAVEIKYGDNTHSIVSGTRNEIETLRIINEYGFCPYFQGIPIIK
jgi:hypothetical protein